MIAPALTAEDAVYLEAAVAPDLWRAVDRLLADASVEGAQVHGVGPLLAQTWRRSGREVPPELAFEEHLAACSMLLVDPLLRRIRAACDGPLVLLKGPEVAALYPGERRRFGDLDLLVPDPGATHRSLREAGFVEVGDPDLYRDLYHLRPLEAPELPLAVEVHAAPKWPQRLTPPPVDEIIAAAVPTRLGIEGVLAPRASHHALLLAAHAWAHEPLQKLRDLVDVAAVHATADPDEVAAVAEAWRVDRLWATTAGAMRWLFDGGPRPFPLRSWARQLPAVRERTVFENHLQKWLAGYWALPAPSALAANAEAVAFDLRPAVEEPWRAKFARARRALLGARMPVSTHNREIGEAARRRRG